MDPNAVFAILLLFAGIGILMAEIFLPSGGFLGVVTFFTLVLSLIFAHRAWWTSHPNFFWVFCCVLLFLIPTALSIAFYVLPKTSFGKKVLLEAPDLEGLTPFVKETTRLMDLVGQYGRTVSPLTPGGIVNVNGERLHAISEGLIVEAGQTIQVLDVRGTRLLVRPAAPPPEGSQAPSPEESSRLDFEIPQS